VKVVPVGRQVVKDMRMGGGQVLKFVMYLEEIRKVFVEEEQIQIEVEQVTWVSKIREKCVGRIFQKQT